MSMFAHPDFDNHEIVSFGSDEESGLRAIIAVHNTALGPAVGGCRMFDYADEAAALTDALRLSRGMTYKSALAGLPMGGGKAVIMGDPQTRKTPALLRAMGRFVETLNGLYITAEDSGTTVADIKMIGTATAHVSGVIDADKFGGDPSPYTALGTYAGIKAAARHRLGVDSLDGIRVAIQGAGSVGFYLAELLLADGAQVFAADVNAANLDRVVQLGTTPVDPQSVLFADVDVLAPCAMGGVINDHTVERIAAPIIAGAANNQLATPGHAAMLREQNILYAPDFVINAGGIIDIYYQRVKSDEATIRAHVLQIADTLTQIFDQAAQTGKTTDQVACIMAEARFKGDGATCAAALKSA